MRLSRRSDLVIQRLFGEILHGSKGRGGKLAPAAAIADEYGISTASVREALKVLESIGILTLAQGKGTLVESPDEIVDEIVETRRIIECNNARKAATNRTDGDIERFHRLRNRLNSAFDSGDVELYSAHDHDLHMLISELSGNRILGKTLDNIRVILHYQQTEVNRVPRSLRASHEDHHHLIDAIVDGDPDRSARIMGEHLDRVGEALKRVMQEREVPLLPGTDMVGSAMPRATL